MIVCYYNINVLDIVFLSLNDENLMMIVFCLFGFTNCFDYFLYLLCSSRIKMEFYFDMINLGFGIVYDYIKNIP